MSIVTVRSWISEKKGCQVFVGIVMFLVMLTFISPMFCSRQGNFAGDPNANEVVVEVEGRPGTTGDLTSIQTVARENRPTTATPREYFDREAGELAQLVDLAAGDALAARYAVKPTREQAIKSFNDSIEQQLMMMRLTMQMQGMLKQDATDKEFNEAIEKQLGRPLDEVKKEELANYEQKLDDPQTGPLIMRSLAVEAVINQLAKTNLPSEEELKKSYETFVFNRLAITDPKLTPEQRQARADKAQAALAGGKSFVDVYKEMIGGTTPAPTEMPMSQIEANPDLAALKTLKPKESVVVTEFGSPAVFQLVTTKTSLPPNYETEKTKLMENFAKQKASKTVQDELKALKEDKSKIVWKSPQAALTYDLYMETTKTPPGTSPAPFMDIIKRSEELESTKQAYSADMVAIIKYVAFEEAYRLSSASEQINMREQRAEYLSAALDVQDNTALREELAGIYKDLKQPDAAADALSKSISNTYTFGEAEVKSVESIEKKAEQWQKDGFFTADHLEMVKSAIKSWRAEKASWDKDEAERKAMEEEARKQADEERKKLEAEAEAERKRLEAEDKKKAEDAKKSGTGTTGTTTPPVGTAGTTGNPLTTTTGR